MPKSDSSTLILALRLFKAIPVFNFIEHNAFKEVLSIVVSGSMKRSAWIGFEVEFILPTV